MRRDVERNTDSGFEIFRASCKGMTAEQVRRDWRIQKANMAVSNEIWNKPRVDPRKSFFPGHPGIR